LSDGRLNLSGQLRAFGEAIERRTLKDSGEL
jgi:hypothetical protein